MFNFDKMFDNIGGKLKKVAKVMTAFGIVLGVLVILASLFNGIDSYGNGFGIFVGGLLGGVAIILTFWISSFSIYAFGDLVEKIAQIESNTHPKEENAFANDMNK